MLPLLGYVVVVIPLRIGFDMTEAVGSVEWWLDLLVDIYFTFDIVLNFRTTRV